MHPAAGASEPTPRAAWPVLLRMYGKLQRAWALADQLNYDDLDYGLPLQVFAWCDDAARLCTPKTEPGAAPTDFAFFAGNSSTAPNARPRPWIGVGDARSASLAPTAPDNVEYHEFGHFFQADILGNAYPRHPDNTPHAGYFKNPSSEDAWTEGFAEFFAMLVAREIDREPFPERYPVGIQHAIYDLEQDHLPWELDGWWEEFTLAGVLWDFIDGDADRRPAGPAPNVDVERALRYETAPGHQFIVGRVVNRGPTVSRQTQVRVEYLRGGQVVQHAYWPADRGDLAPDERSDFRIVVPVGLDFQDFRVTAAPGVVRDDDPLQVPVSELLAAIEGFQSTQQYSGGRLFDVHDLYQALKKAFGGRARAADGRDAVDAIFIAHGFFADLNGNGRYDGEIDPDQACLSPADRAKLKADGRRAGEEIGLTSRCKKGEHEAVVPRYSPVEPPPEALVAIDTGGVKATALVHLAFPAPREASGYGYYVEPDAHGRVHVAMPPPASGATATIVMLAPGYLPAVAATIPVDAYWQQADQNPGRSFLAYRVALQPGDITRLTPVTPAPDLTPAAIGVGAGAAAALGLGGLGLLVVRWRRRTE